MGLYDHGWVTIIDPDEKTGTIWMRSSDWSVLPSVREGGYSESRRGKWNIFAVAMPEEMLGGDDHEDL